VTDGPEQWLAARLAAGKPAETWKPIPGWEATHEVSDQGRVRTVRGRILTQRPTNRPVEAPPERRYRKTNLCANGDQQTVDVHPLVLGAHAGPRPDGMVSRHLGNPPNPAWNWWPEGLAWGTPPENEQDKPPEVRVAAARRARAAQIGAHAPSRKPKPRGLRRVVVTVRNLWRRTYNSRSERPITNSAQPITKQGSQAKRRAVGAAPPRREPVTEGDRHERGRGDGE
jgi:NUMOD4 motif